MHSKPHSRRKCYRHLVAGPGSAGHVPVQVLCTARASVLALRRGTARRESLSDLRGAGAVRRAAHSKGAGGGDGGVRAPEVRNQRRDTAVSVQTVVRVRGFAD
eukprot:7556-Rhodomonas_salina.4